MFREEKYVNIHTLTSSRAKIAVNTRATPYRFLYFFFWELRAFTNSLMHRSERKTDVLICISEAYFSDNGLGENNAS